MTQRTTKAAAVGNGNQFPPEAYEYSDDVTTETVARIRDMRGVDVSQPKWKVIEAFGQIVHT